jgi:hypothetical protein
MPDPVGHFAVLRCIFAASGGVSDDLAGGFVMRLISFDFNLLISPC